MVINDFNSHCVNYFLQLKTKSLNNEIIAMTMKENMNLQQLFQCESNSIMKNMILEKKNKFYT